MVWVDIFSEVIGDYLFKYVWVEGNEKIIIMLIKLMIVLFYL